MAIEFNPVSWFQSVATAFSSVQKKIKEGQAPDSLKNVIDKALADHTAAQNNELRNKTVRYEPLEGPAIGREVATEDQIDHKLEKLDSDSSRISQLKKERFASALFSILSVFSKPHLIHTWNAEMSQVSNDIAYKEHIPGLQKELTEAQYTICRTLKDPKLATDAKTSTETFMLFTKNDSYSIKMDERRGIVSLQKGAEPEKEFTSYSDMLQSLKLNGKPEFKKVLI